MSSFWQRRLNKKLSKAIVYTNLAAFTQCLENGADVNLAEGHIYGSPLCVAARAVRYNDEERDKIIAMVRALLTKGADPNAEEKENSTALLQALDKGNWGAATALVESGARVDVRSAKGAAPLPLAAALGATKLVALLLEKGADVEGTSPPGYNALHYAAIAGNGEIMKLLAEAGADANVKTPSGVTALHIVAEKGWANLARILMDAGADVTAVNANMNSPADLAEKEFPRVADMIRGGAKAAPAKEAPAAQNDAQDPFAGWTRTAPDEVAHVSEKPAIGYRVTGIFNFSARVFTQLAENLRSGAESQTVTPFSALGDGHGDRQGDSGRLAEAAAAFAHFSGAPVPEPAPKLGKPVLSVRNAPGG